ncbi:MAG: hypothetical protein ABR606_03230 [Vicinamibacterales bacterium]
MVGVELAALCAVSVALAASACAVLWLVLAGRESRGSALPGDDRPDPGPVACEDAPLVENGGSPIAPTETLADAGSSSLTRWDRLAVGLSLLLALVVAYQLGMFHLWSRVATPDGEVWLPDTFASVDHPFHIGRAETVRRALIDGVIPRWIGHHQGGYPAEFYPLGVAWLEVAVWTLTGGLLPIAAVHKIVVIAIFLSPGLAFALIARRDGLPLTAGLMAFCLHVLAPGGELQGGYTELVYMGLVTNVAAAIAGLFWLLFLTDYLDQGGARVAAVAAAVAAFAVFANPRAVLGLAAIGLAAGVTCGWKNRHCREPGGRRARNVKALLIRFTSGLLVRRLATVAFLTGLLAGPELFSLLRFGHLYHFIRYSSYDTANIFVQASTQAVSLPVALLGLGGLATSWRYPALMVTRGAALVLALFLAFTAVVDSSLGPMLFPQLESVRLMPLQRLLTIYLASFMVHVLLFRVPVWTRLRAAGQRHVLALGATAPLLLAVIRPQLLIPEEQRSLYPVETSGTGEMVDFLEGVRAARDAAPEGTAVLVLGSAVSTHQQLWAPVVAPGPFFYDHWLWYWHTLHFGSYDPFREIGYPWGGSALRREYLDRHAIGAVVATGDVRATAATSPHLTHRRSGSFGAYDVYAVRSPSRLVSLPGLPPVRSRLDTHSIHVTGTGSGGMALIRHNWHPRWRATVNDVPVTVSRRADGYMSVLTPPGQVRLDLQYRRDVVDRVTLVGTVAGWATVVWCVVTPRLRSRRGRGRAAALE